jgi:GTP cyclohydrolase FolE2
MSIVNKRRIKVGYESSSLEWLVYQENPSKYCRTFHKSDLHDNYTGKTFHTYAVVVGLSCAMSTCPCAVKTEEHRVTSEVEREDTLYRIIVVYVPVSNRMFHALVIGSACVDW